MPTYEADARAARAARRRLGIPVGAVPPRRTGGRGSRACSPTGAASRPARAGRSWATTGRRSSGKPNMSGTLLVTAVEPYERLAFHLTGERLDVRADARRAAAPDRTTARLVRLGAVRSSVSGGRCRRRRSLGSTGFCKQRQTCSAHVRPPLPRRVARRGLPRARRRHPRRRRPLRAAASTKKADLKAAQPERDEAAGRQPRRGEDAGSTQRRSRRRRSQTRLSRGDARPPDGKRIARALRRLRRRRRRASRSSETLAGRGRGPAARVLSLKVPVDAPNRRRRAARQAARVRAVRRQRPAREPRARARARSSSTGGRDAALEGARPPAVTEQTRQRAAAGRRCRRRPHREPQQGDTTRFLRGLYSGLATTGIPVVGVENSNTKLSAVEGLPRARLLDGRRRRRR